MSLEVNFGCTRAEKEKYFLYFVNSLKIRGKDTSMKGKEAVTKEYTAGEVNATDIKPYINL